MSVFRGGAARKKICLLEMRERMRFSKRSSTSSLSVVGCYVVKLRDMCWVTAARGGGTKARHRCGVKKGVRIWQPREKLIKRTHALGAEAEDNEAEVGAVLQVH